MKGSESALVDKKLWHEEDDNLQSEIDREVKLTQDFDLLNQNLGYKHNGEVPINNLDIERNCPRCAGKLAYKEHTRKNQNVYLYCLACGLQVFAEDIDYQDEIPDQLYRSIPKDVQLFWNTFRENSWRKNR